MTLFGYTQRDLRRKNKISLKEMSEALGLGETTLENIESGYILPDEKVAGIIAGFFGVTVGYMMGSVEITLKAEGEETAVQSPQRFVKLRPVSVDIFGEGTHGPESSPARDIILPLPASDRSSYMAVRWGDNSMTRYRIEAGDILVVREDAYAVRNGDLVLVTTADKKTILRRYFREGGEIELRSDADDLLLPIRLRVGDGSYRLLGSVTEILVEVNDSFLERRAKNPPMPAEELHRGAAPLSEKTKLYLYPENKE
ncbi:MAG: helix-turn-helix domain-containing protein [Clostridia bacterium]|nr:helix-turn-helix domain-containing protein [Clostridia bacterium]